MTTDAMKMSAAELAAAIKQMGHDEGREYVKRATAKDLDKIGITPRDIAKAESWAKLTPEEREIIREGKLREKAEREAQRLLEIERERFFAEIRKEYGAA